MKLFQAALLSAPLLFAQCAPELQKVTHRSGQDTQNNLRARQDLLERAPYTIPAHRIDEYLSNPQGYLSHRHTPLDTGTITILGKEYLLLPKDTTGSQ